MLCGVDDACGTMAITRLLDKLKRRDSNTLRQYKMVRNLKRWRVDFELLCPRWATILDAGDSLFRAIARVVYRDAW
jgi:hypothetical protein